MKKVLLSVLVATGFVFAFQAEVKKSEVKLSINDKSVTYEPGDKFMLNPGDLICFIEGKGRVVIRGKSYRKQLTRHTRSCKHLPEENGKSASYTVMLKSSVVSMFGKSKEKSVDGVSRKAVEEDTLTDPISFAKDAKYLSVENSTWGPLPVTLTIYDDKGKVVETMANEEDIVTSFVLPKSMLRDGYRLKVTNAFDEVLVNSTIKMEKGKE